MKLTKYVLLIFLMIPVIGCNPPEHLDMELVGHRGATGLLPENTIPGFIKAVDLGADAIEFDVIISGDDQVVITHEPWFRHDICLTPEGEPIERDEQMNYNMYEMTYDQITEFDCGSLQRPGFSDQETMPLPKPLMRDAISAVEAHITENGLASITYYVEIKSRPDWDHERQPEPARVARLVYDELADLDVLERSKILAFDVRMLQEMRAIDPSLTQVYLIPSGNPDMEENLGKLDYLPDVYAPHYSLIDSVTVQEAHRRGMQIIPWTVNSFDEMIRLISLGVDGIISDYPNYFQSIRDGDYRED